MLKNKIRLITNKEYLFKVIIFAVAILFFGGCTILDENTPVKKDILTITTKSSLVQDESGEIIFRFSESVSGFTTNDIELSNVMVEVKKEVTARTGKGYSEYTWEITPKQTGILTVKVVTNSFRNNSGDFNANSISKKFLVYKSSGGKFSLKEIVVDLGVIPDDMSRVDELSKDVLSYYTRAYLPEVVAKYVKVDGDGDGSAGNKSANHITNVLENILDSRDSKIYLILVRSGEYLADKMAMKNHVAVIGGWSPNTDWERAGETRFDGQGSYRVFYNSRNNLNQTALLYSVTITNGEATHKGGGMHNNSSSPTLVNVTFSGNQAKSDGGGMYNNNSSPTLVNVTFSGNKALGLGENGEGDGGGMYNNNSSPTLVNVTFSGNTAKNDGGGMYISGNSGRGHLVVNTIFWGNQAKEVANQISFLNSTDKLSLHYSIIQGGTSTLGGSLTSSHNFSDDPLLSTLADNGGFVQIGDGSPAIDKGVYVKKLGDTLYFSQDNTTWYTGLNNNGLTTTATLPDDAEDLTATDSRGYNRVGRPDIGAHEHGVTVPTAN